jgi:hypothetical protein
VTSASSGGGAGLVAISFFWADDDQRRFLGGKNIFDVGIQLREDHGFNVLREFRKKVAA